MEPMENTLFPYPVTPEVSAADKAKINQENQTALTKLIVTGIINPDSKQHILAGDLEPVLKKHPQDLHLNEMQLDIFNRALVKTNLESQQTNQPATFEKLCQSITDVLTLSSQT